MEPYSSCLDFSSADVSQCKEIKEDHESSLASEALGVSAVADNHVDGRRRVGLRDAVAVGDVVVDVGITILRRCIVNASWIIISHISIKDININNKLLRVDQVIRQ
jgi:hypothetical protein